MKDSLESLLDRCHRDELEPLAQKLGVNAQRLGLADLARATSLALRQQASDPVHVGFRRGQPLSYEQLLQYWQRRIGLKEAEPELVEQQLLAYWLETEWKLATLEQRQQLWRELTGCSELPQNLNELNQHTALPTFAIAKLLSKHQAIWRSALPLAALGPIAFLLRPLLLPLTPLLMWWWMRPTETKILPFLLEIARLRQLVQHRVTIGVVGSPSSGKDSALRCLFGIETGNISPIAGSTTEVSIQQLPYASELYIVNTPGLGDVLESVSEQAAQVLHHIDVYLYILNAEGGVQKRELDDYRRCIDTGKPVLVIVNKIDLLREKDKQKLLEDCQQKLQCSSENFMAAAFDPRKEIASQPIGREAIVAWMRQQLMERGKSPAELEFIPMTPEISEANRLRSWLTEPNQPVTFLFVGLGPANNIDAEIDMDKVVISHQAQQWIGAWPAEEVQNWRRLLLSSDFAQRARQTSVQKPAIGIRHELGTWFMPADGRDNQLLDSVRAAIDLTTFGELDAS